MNLTCPVLILTVDDEPDLCVLTKEFLERSGHIKVDTAGSVSEARVMITQKHYDVIVSDYQMPNEDGIQFLKSLRASGDTTPFILFTGKGREEVVIEAFDNGADAYLQKGGEPRSLFVELEHRIETIVRRHHAEAALLDSESEFRTLFENSPDPIVLISLDGKILNTNQAGARMVLMSKEEIIGSTISDMGVFSENDVAIFQQNMIAMMKGEPVSPVVSRIHRKDGTVRWVEIRASVVMKSGRFHAIQIIARDFTKRKNAEEALKKDDSRNKALFELTRMSGVTPKDIAQKAMDSCIELTQSQIGHIAFLNEDESVMMMQHYSKQAMEMSSVEGKPMTFNVGSTGLLAEAVRQRKPVITNDYDAPNPMKKGLPHGHIKIKNHMSVPVFDQGRIVAVVGVGNKDSDYSEQDATDVSLLMDGMWRIVRKIEAEEALRESEKKFRMIAENTADIIWTMDFNLDFTYISPSVTQVRGYTVEEAMKQSIDRVLIPSSLETALKLLEEEKVHENMDRNIVRKVELDEYCRDGTIIRTDNTLSILRDEMSRPIGIVGVTRDITRRKHVEEGLREANRQLSVAMDLAQLVYWEYDESSDMFTFNDRFYNLCGTNVEREGCYCISREAYYRDFIHPDDVGFVKEMAAKAPNYLSNNLHFSHRIIRRDGEVRFIEVYPCQIKDDKGNVVKVFGVNQDITENRGNEEALRASETKLKHAEEVAGFGHWQLDLNSKTISGSNGLMILCGLDKTLFTYDEWKEIPLSEHRCLLDKALRDLIEEGKQYDVEFKVRRPKDGKIVYVHSVAEYDCVKNMVFGVLQDITERKRLENELRESEKFYRELMSNLSLGVVIVDPKTRTIESVNGAAATMFGSSEENIVGNRCYSYLCTGLDGPCPVYDRGMEVKNLERTMECADGSRRPILKTVKRINIRGQERMLECFMDITERERAQSALRETNKKLNLLSGITRHDITNQLMSLEGNLSLLESDQLDQSSVQHIRKAETAAKRISAMIQFTKTYEDIGIQAPSWQNVNILIEKCAKEVNLGEIVMVNDVPDGIEVFADPLISKVFLNLIQNAKIHGGKIKTIRFSLGERDKVPIIVVEDDGNGIPADMKEKLFTKGFGKDHGLGLFLSREILSITGITITEEGEPGKGAKFVITPPGNGIRATPPD